MKIDWAARRRKVDSRSLEKFLFLTVKDFPAVTVKYDRRLGR